jgi:hypothetical protein
VDCLLDALSEVPLEPVCLEQDGRYFLVSSLLVRCLHGIEERPVLCETLQDSRHHRLLFRRRDELLSLCQVLSCQLDVVRGRAQAGAVVGDVAHRVHPRGGNARRCQQEQPIGPGFDVGDVPQAARQGELVGHNQRDRKGQQE